MLRLHPGTGGGAAVYGRRGEETVVPPDRHNPPTGVDRCRIFNGDARSVRLEFVRYCFGAIVFVPSEKMTDDDG